ncbi:MAG: (d)CMP kinase [Thermoguttaceae bacterium]|nr:(d)CMP kinase [Thermoguttaceae bacterium]MDW8077917.1 (d)CMP kinase [Thermoguttaceae bacterium]
MIVTIDGPAGAGKSTVAKLLAARLGFEYLDTGAMYRAVAWAALQAGIDLANPEELANFARNLDITVHRGQVFVDGKEVGEPLRTPEVTQASRYAADNDAVRAHLVTLQRRYAAGRNVVTEGRDQGSLVFPEAEVKFFLTASPEERARRRLREYERAGHQVPSFEEVLQELNARDQRDASRPWGRLVKPPGAIEVATDGLSVEQVVNHLEAVVRAAIAEKSKRGEIAAERCGQASSGTTG